MAHFQTIERFSPCSGFTSPIAAARLGAALQNPFAAIQRIGPPRNALRDLIALQERDPRNPERVRRLHERRNAASQAIHQLQALRIAQAHNHLLAFRSLSPARRNISKASTTSADVLPRSRFATAIRTRRISAGGTCACKRTVVFLSGCAMVSISLLEVYAHWFI